MLQQELGDLLTWLGKYQAAWPVVLAVVGAFGTAFVYAIKGLWTLYKHRLERRERRTSLEREFPAPELKQLQADLCQALRAHLNDLDRYAHWQHEAFVPLDAEVNVLSQGKKVDGLWTCLPASAPTHGRGCSW